MERIWSRSSLRVVGGTSALSARATSSCGGHVRARLLTRCVVDDMYASSCSYTMTNKSLQHTRDRLRAWEASSAGEASPGASDKL